MTAKAQPATSIDPVEVGRFSKMSAMWWDTQGPFRPLHQINPVRLRYIRDRLCAQFARDPNSTAPLRGLRIADIGCGGGLLCEPMRRLGAEVVGVDPSEENVEIARQHATEAALEIDYVQATAEDLAAWGEKFDAVLNMEVIEHVSDVQSFVAACAALLRADDSAMLLATLNRTLKAYFLAIVGAEYVLGWLPKGTHDWNRFVRPSELRATLAKAGLKITDLKGITYMPLPREWQLSANLDVNYLAFATRT
ncbi:MAG: bifunctional 2-polyprenyl-6-hydroxyphenol methylase/3-demethylubiquinol 3-O-methyltransferase UbiG [Proteobacteria bacterium]|nr:bifunctional 2-polyprenyl-6-hydroxyphenol methylase/3-demethylubiquinol 3-O-methyltransferase UbiG [Pseudomonadota bacterium]MDA1057483.1 bifunctional 2-polyprenyl-6-hydroxyphenol methylase/3-demethylubiquinol 3-O-methyltransferase UbiG [Pseudomonadota bacterium]